MGLIDEIAHAVDPDAAALRGAAQGAAGLVPARASGPRSTSATSRPTTCCALETLRLGPALRHDVSAPMILLARHGETDDNVRAAALPGPGATRRSTTRGREQARELARARRGASGVALAVLSPLPRARETAEIVGERDRPGAAVDARLAETDAATGRAACSTRSSAEDPERLRGLARRRRGLPLPGRRVARASSRSAWSRRCATSAAPAPLPALVVCHGGSIRVALCHTDPRGLAAFHDCDVPNGALPPWPRRRVTPRSRRRRFAALVAADRSARSSSPSASSTRPPVVRRFSVTPRLLPQRRRALGRARALVPPQAGRRRHGRRPRPPTATSCGPLLSRPLAAGARARCASRWDGRTDDGALRARRALPLPRDPAPQGRSVVVPRSVRLDATPPAPGRHLGGARHLPGPRRPAGSGCAIRGSQRQAPAVPRLRDRPLAGAVGRALRGDRATARW